ncbi:MAG: DUF3598 family protein [Drouetiella hepatica Uher 2000/2452]|jgi:hypothetical protein|uniref:DUF3598 family protein n=1 Tax=Drouetiella hepatica Uher 2000/2452 TaxID=904376 RepID=A0A951Q8E8_9CYAN|nr:DUF3598 family protein [Drouetiella hepatica Uher 2000/2452]
MKSQWDCVLQNLGEWQGSFTHFSAQGEMLQDIPSVISLEGIHQNQAIHLVLKRFYPIPGSAELQPKELVMDFSAPGSGALFFENGAFSEGKAHFSPHSPFIAEFCLLDGEDQIQGKAERRSRLVQFFNAGRQHQLTLIREKRTGSVAPEQPRLKLEDLLGEWQGKAVTLHPHVSLPEPKISDAFFSLDRVSEGELLQQFYSPEDDAIHSAIATCQDTTISFSWYEQPYRTVLLPDGASSTCPMQIHAQQPFFLEAGWLQSPGVRQRLIRRYNSEGNWSSVTWIQEYRVN